MAKRTILDAAQQTVVKAAKVGAEGVKDVATDALGAAASAAAGVVLGRVSDALGSGQKKADEAAPRVSQALSTTTPSRRKPIKKGSRNSERAATPRRAKKQNITKKRSQSKASRTKAATATRAKPRKGGTRKKAARGRR